MRLSPSLVLLRAQSDERLTALAREGSEPAFTALVERYRRSVLRACMRVLPEARAEDATQQVFMSAWKALARGDDIRDVRPWLLRIARNTALNALRTPGYEYDELAESLTGGSAPPAELERRDVMRQTLAGLAALPENQREALLRSAVQGAAHADIARDLGISEGATRQLVLRARASMRSVVTAVTPMPLLHWAETAAGGGAAAGATAFIAKAGAVVVIAGGAVATPGLVSKSEQPTAKAAAKPERVDRERPARAPDNDGAAEATDVAQAEAPKREVTPAVRRGGSAARPGRQRRGDDDSSGSSHSGSSGSSDPSGSSGSSRPAGSSTPSPVDDHGDDDHSGPGGGDDDDEVAEPTAAPPVVPTAAATAVPTVNPNSGSGSGSSGSGSSGSGRVADDDPADDDHSGSGGGGTD